MRRPATRPLCERTEIFQQFAREHGTMATAERTRPLISVFWAKSPYSKRPHPQTLLLLQRQRRPHPHRLQWASTAGARVIFDSVLSVHCQTRRARHTRTSAHVCETKPKCVDVDFTTMTTTTGVDTTTFSPLLHAKCNMLNKRRCS